MDTTRKRVKIDGKWTDIFVLQEYFLFKREGSCNLYRNGGND